MGTPTNYQVDISLNPATVSTLINGGYFLYTMFAIRMTDAAARPTIWSGTTSIMAKMTVEWSSSVSAYTSSSEITRDARINIGYETEIDDGQTFEVVAGGGGQVKTEGPALKITIMNTTNTQFTSGFARSNAGESVSIYAVPLYGNQTNVASALPRVLLQFTTGRFEPGTVMENYAPISPIDAAYGPSLLVDATDNGPRQVAYDVNAGWSWGDYSWARTILANADLTKVLIVPE